MAAHRVAADKSDITFEAELRGGRHRRGHSGVISAIVDALSDDGVTHITCQQREAGVDWSSICDAQT